MANLNRIQIFRMVHIDNIPHIIKYGLTHWKSSNQNSNYVPIGDKSLIKTRNTSNLSDENNIGDYLPFYFSTRTPMLYVIQNGLNDVKKIVPEDIIYCVVTLQAVIDEGLDFKFTDGHASSKLTTFYDTSHIKDIEKLVDFDAVKKKYWTEELDLKRKKAAEFLVKGDVPLSRIIGFAVYSEAARDKLVDLGVPLDKIGIRPNFYF